MTPQTELLQIMTEAAEKNCSLDTTISLDELKKEGGIYAELGEGFTDAMYYTKDSVKIIPVLFLCRHKDQRRCIDQLSDICNYFQRLMEYPQAETFSWMDCTIAKEPSKIGRDEDGTYHGSCILNNRIYF